MFAPVKRTSILLLAAASACADKKSAPPEPTPSSPAAALAIDASVLGEPSDPPAPAGDLKAELDRFVNVDTCVAERSRVDPLIGDALGAIGYETFFRDACRLLEAAKDKKREICDRIDASSLRSRCRSWVAMVALTPDACPLQFEGAPARGRQPTCVAVAARDPRLCAGEALAPRRATCEGLVLRDAAKCESLVPSPRAACEREVARWKGVLLAPLEGLAPIDAPKGKLTLRGATGTADPAVIQPEIDLAPDLARGLVAITSGGRVRIELGSFVESEIARIAAPPQKRMRLGLALVLEEAAKRATVQKLELEIPGDAPIVSPPGSCDCAVSGISAVQKRGDPVTFKLEGTLSSNGRSYKIAADATTFVRDVVADTPGSRLLPAMRDAGIKHQ
jgi:hypothetical protein